MTGSPQVPGTLIAGPAGGRGQGSARLGESAGPAVAAAGDGRARGDDGPAGAPGLEPAVRVVATGERVMLRAEVTTVGRGQAAGIRLDDLSVSVLHAELVRRGPYVYVADQGLSANGTLVNGRPVTRRLLAAGDVLCFGAAAAVITGIAVSEAAGDRVLGRPAVPELTRRETEVLGALCRPALGQDAFIAPATPAEIAAALVVTEAAVKQHLLRLYAKFRIPEGATRRLQLANTAIANGLAALPILAAAMTPAAAPGLASSGEAAGPGDPVQAAAAPGTPLWAAPGARTASPRTGPGSPALARR
jgi:hypothetical protein